MPDKTSSSDPVDVGTELAHRLIRAEARDESDPFMIEGHPNLDPGKDRVVRACFYYAVVARPNLTILYDNWDEGGMCKMVPDEWRAVWRTPELLAALGTTYDQLRDGTAVLNDSPIPPPAIGMDALTEILSAAREYKGRDAGAEHEADAERNSCTAPGI